MNVVNLEKLANYLASGGLKARFNMASYSEIIGGQRAETTCGAVGCAVGHAPFVSEDMFKIDNESWNDYCFRVLGVHAESVEWHWCFSAEWESWDNTPAGASARIKYLLAGNTIEDEFVDEVDGSVDEAAIELDKYLHLYSKFLPQ